MPGPELTLSGGPYRHVQPETCHVEDDELRIDIDPLLAEADPYELKLDEMIDAEPSLR